jgi:hypothetical protein
LGWVGLGWVGRSPTLPYPTLPYPRDHATLLFSFGNRSTLFPFGFSKGKPKEGKKLYVIKLIDGEATFFTNKFIPRFKLENNIKELELYNKIREFIATGKVLYTTSRTDKNPTVVLELNKVKELIENLIPLIYHEVAAEPPHTKNIKT